MDYLQTYVSRQQVCLKLRHFYINVSYVFNFSKFKSGTSTKSTFPCLIQIYEQEKECSKEHVFNYRSLF